MKSPFRMVVLGGAVLTLSLGAIAALAQTTTTTTTTSADGAKVERRVMVVRKDGDHEGGRWMHRDPAEMQKRAADHLRTMLQLTPQQEPALQTFLASMKPPEGAPRMGEHRMDMAAARGADGKIDPAKMHADMEKMHQEMAKKHEAAMAMTTPQRLDAMIKRMAERQAKMQTHVDAVKRFYAALTLSQQKVFDSLHGGMMGWMRHDAPGEGGPGMRRHEMQFGMMGPMQPPPPFPPPPPAGER